MCDRQARARWAAEGSSGVAGGGVEVWNGSSQGGWHWQLCDLMRKLLPVWLTCGLHCFVVDWYDWLKDKLACKPWSYGSSKLCCVTHRPTDEGEVWSYERSWKYIYFALHLLHLFEGSKQIANGLRYGVFWGLNKFKTTLSWSEWQILHLVGMSSKCNLSWLWLLSVTISIMYSKL